MRALTNSLYIAQACTLEGACTYREKCAYASECFDTPRGLSVRFHRKADLHAFAWASTTSAILNGSPKLATRREKEDTPCGTVLQGARGVPLHGRHSDGPGVRLHHQTLTSPVAAHPAPCHMRPTSGARPRRPTFQPSFEFKLTVHELHAIRILPHG